MPDGPIGTRKTRVRKALYWYWTRDLTQAEIGDKLGVSRQKVNEYLNESPQSEAVQEQMANLEAKVRYVAVQELREQLKAAGDRARSAEKPVEVWQDEQGDLRVKDQYNERGEIVDRYPLPQDYELGADEKARYYARDEVREILDQLCELVGAKDPQELRVDQDVSGAVGLELEADEKEQLDQLFGADTGTDAESG